jgi:AcrR family transcriptional regulator
VSRRSGISNEAARKASREALLQAGAALFVEESRREPFAAIKIRELCNRAEYTTGAFYVHWNGIPHYREDLLRYLLALDAEAWDDDFAELRAVAANVDLSDPLAAVDTLASDDLKSVLENPIWNAMAIFAVTAGFGAARNEAAAGYTSIDHATAGLYGVLLDRLGREPRPPFTLEQIGTILQATVEGLAIRHRIQPDAVDLDPNHGSEATSAYSAAVASLIVSLTRPRNDTTDFATHIRNALDAGTSGV